MNIVNGMLNADEWTLSTKKEMPLISALVKNQTEVLDHRLRTKGPQRNEADLYKKKERK